MSTAVRDAQDLLRAIARQCEYAASQLERGHWNDARLTGVAAQERMAKVVPELVNIAKYK